MRFFFFAVFISIALPAMELSIPIPSKDGTSPRESSPPSSTSPKRILAAVLRTSKNAVNKVVSATSLSNSPTNTNSSPRNSKKVTFQEFLQEETLTQEEITSNEFRQKLSNHLTHKINKHSKKMNKNDMPELVYTNSFENTEYALKFIRQDGKIICLVDCSALLSEL